MRLLSYLSIIGLLLSLTVGCTPSPQQLQKALEENPDILVGAIKKNPKAIMDALNTAAQEARKKAAEDEDSERKQALEEEFKNPKKPEIESDRAVHGPENAPITIVEYSDFECPYCSKGYQTVKEVLKKYGDKVKVVYKHLPLDFHPLAMPAAQYFEAIAIQNADKAYEFHDKVFENQSKMKTEKEKFFESIAKSLGVDMAKLKKDLDSDEVKNRIEADKAEANKFGFFGTPGFLVNGVSIRGAYPASEFEKIIERHMEQN